MKQEKEETRKHLFDGSFREVFSEAISQIQKPTFSSVSTICVTMEGDFVHENWNKYIHKPHIQDEPKANTVLMNLSTSASC